MSAVLPASAMRRVTCTELKNLAAAYRPALYYAAAQCARETKIYLHWTAGHYGQFFADYHVQIDADGTLYVIGDGALDVLLAATYRRNSGSVSVAVLGACGATTEHLGAEPPTAAQIEAMAMAVTALADGLWLTIDKARILTHGEAADNEDGVRAHAPYGPLDMRALGPRVPRNGGEPRVSPMGRGRHARRRCAPRKGTVVSSAQIDCPARAERILIYDHGIPQIPIDSIKMTVSHIMSANMTGGHFIGEIKGLSWNKQNTGIPSSSY